MASLHPLPSLSPEPPAEKPPAAWRQWLLYYAPPLLLMLVIFMASTDVGSSEHSGHVLSRLLSWMRLDRWVTNGQLEAMNHYVRKLGHLSEYALLAGLIHRAIMSGHTNPRGVQARWTLRAGLAVLGVVALYAASDEFHQLFVAGRTPSAWDVLLDTTGGAVGLALKRGWEKRWIRRRSG